MAVMFDGLNKRIIVQLGTDILDITDMYSRWVDWFLTGDNSKYLPALKYVGTDPTVQGQWITPYFYMMNGWKIDACYEFMDIQHELDITGIILVDQPEIYGNSPFWMEPGMSMTMIRQIVPIRTETVSTSGSDVDIPSIVNGVWGKTVKTGMTAQQAVVEISDFVEDPPAASVDVPSVVDGILNTPDTIKEGMSVKGALVETSNFVEAPPIAQVDIPAIVDGILNTEDGVEPGFSVNQALRLLLAVIVAKATSTGTSTITKTFRDINDSKDRLTGVVSDTGRTVEVLDKN